MSSSIQTPSNPSPAADPYQETIRKYGEIYELTSREQLLERWLSNESTLNVYMHSPFCSSICKFCYYKGTLFDSKTQGPIYDRFYNDYLPEAVRPFHPVLESRAPNNYFFGGGTPSLMTPQVMQDVFALFPRFHEARSKTFEVHPAIWQKEQIDLLADNGFNCCIIGVQSFDEGVLNRQTRLHASYETVLELSDYIKSKGMYVAIDLIYFMDRIDPDAIFQRDLEYASQLDPHVMSLQVNYDLGFSDEHQLRFFQHIEQSGLAGRFYWEDAHQLQMTVAYKKILKCFRLVRNDIPVATYDDVVFPFRASIDEGSKLAGSGRKGLPSVIGFGSYQNSRKNTFSLIRDDHSVLEYIEVNDNWQPQYYIVFEANEDRFFDDAIAELNRLREIGSPPRGIKISVENKVAVRNENHIFREPGRQARLSVRWEYMNADIEAYIEKLKVIFPHWKWRADDNKPKLPNQQS